MRSSNQTFLRSVVATAIMGGLILLSAGITCSASNISKKKISPAPTLSGKTGQSARVSPYIVVERIYLKDGIVHLRIRNKGKGKLDPEAYERGTLSLHLGKAQKTWPLKKIDPRRILNQGMAVIFDSGVKISRQTTALVFFTHIPGKKKNTVLSPPHTALKKISSCFCIEVFGHGTGGSVRGRDARGVEWNLEAPVGVIGALTGLKIGHFYEICGSEPDRSIVVGHPFIVTRHTETSMPCTGQLPTVRKTPLIWCCVKGKISRTSNDICKKADGSPFKSEKEAKKVCGGNTQFPSLTHQLPGFKEQKSAMTPIGKIQGALPLDIQSKIPKAVPKSVERGIRIESPTSSHAFYQGETITVSYSFIQDHAEAGDITFTAIHSGIGGGSDYTTVAYNPLTDYRVTKEIELTFSPDAPVGEYAIVAGHPPSRAYGASDHFMLEENSAQINFLRPDTGDLFHPGGTLNMRYQFSRRIEPGTITFDLYSRESSTPLATITNRYRPGSADMPLQAVWLLDWPLPSGISCESCFIVATHPNAIGTSNTFAIQPFDEGTAVDEPYDIEIVDIFRQDDGVVKARIQVNGFFADSIDIRVNTNVIRALVNSSHQTDVVVGEMLTPVILSGLDRYAEGETFEVEVDPLHRFHETDELNNTLTKTLYYWDSFGDIYVSHNRDRIISGGSIRVPCNLSDYERSNFAIVLTIKNYGSEPIRNFNHLIEVRQSGRRSIGGGRLGSEDFDEVVPSSSAVMASAGEATIPAGLSGRIILKLNDLIVRADSTITFNMSGPIAAWSGIVNPYTVNLHFGSISMSGECRY